MNDQDRANHRPIRSFVKREGRLTSGQQRALYELFPHYRLPTDRGTVDFCDIFGNTNPVILEIGFGNGRLLAQQSMQYPDYNFIGLEVHRPGVGHLLQQLHQNHTENVRIASDDAIEVLTHTIPEQSLDALWLFFPDPWPKKRHHKRRIVNPGFLQLVRSCLKANAVVHMATDWQDYAEHMLETMNNSALFQPTSLSDITDHYPFERPQTHFEQRGLRKGHTVYDYYFTPNDH